MRQLVMNLMTKTQIIRADNKSQVNKSFMSLEVKSKMYNLQAKSGLEDPLLHGIRILVTTKEFTRVKKSKFAYSLKGYKSVTKKANRKAMQIFLLASQHYNVGNLYFSAQTFRRSQFSSNNQVFCCHDFTTVDDIAKIKLQEALQKLGVSEEIYNKGTQMPKDLTRINIPGDKARILEEISDIMKTDKLPIVSIKKWTEEKGENKSSMDRKRC